MSWRTWPTATLFLFITGCGIGSDDCDPQTFVEKTIGGTVAERSLEKHGPEGQEYQDVLSVGLLATTLNLLYESGLEPALNLTRSEKVPTWQDRKDNIVKIILNYKPDLLALQESTPFQAGCMQRQLSDYNFVYGEGLSDSILAYRREAFAEKRRGAQRLPYPKSLFPSFTSLIPRGLAWASLHHVLSGKNIFAAAVHLDNRNRNFQADAMHDAVKKFATDEELQIIMGDTNIDANSPAFEKHLAVRGFKDSFAEAKDVREGREGNKRTFILDDRRIDHILYKGPFEVSYWEVTRLPSSKRYFSDHLPVTVRFDVFIPKSDGSK